MTAAVVPQAAWMQQHIVFHTFFIATQVYVMSSITCAMSEVLTWQSLAVVHQMRCLGKFSDGVLRTEFRPSRNTDESQARTKICTARSSNGFRHRTADCCSCESRHFIDFISKTVGARRMHYRGHCIRSVAGFILLHVSVIWDAMSAGEAHDNAADNF